MSQMTVINETDPNASKAYSKAVYVEFLEAIGRTAHLLFEGSEMAELELKDKIEHVLTELLKSVNKKVTKNRIIIEEFSDSDCDY